MEEIIRQHIINDFRILGLEKEGTKILIIERNYNSKIRMIFSIDDIIVRKIIQDIKNEFTQYHIISLENPKELEDEINDINKYEDKSTLRIKLLVRVIDLKRDAVVIQDYELAAKYREIERNLENLLING